MRATLLIFAVLGLAAIGLAVVIGTGLIHLSALDPITRPPVASSAGVTSTQPSPDSEDGDGGDAGTQPAADPADAASGSPSGSGPESRPTIADRSVFLPAADARLTGPLIALVDKNAQVLRSGADRAGQHNPARPDPDAGPDGKSGKKHSTRTYPPYIARWNSDKDVAEWTFLSPAAGAYTVTLVYSGPPARGEEGDGSPYVVSAGGEPLVVRLKPTAKPTTFEMVDVGTVTLPSGEVRLSIHPQAKQTGREAIHLRSVRLFPAG